MQEVEIGKFVFRQRILTVEKRLRFRNPDELRDDILAMREGQSIFVVRLLNVRKGVDKSMMLEPDYMDENVPRNEKSCLFLLVALSNGWLCSRVRF